MAASEGARDEARVPQSAQLHPTSDWHALPPPMDESVHLVPQPRAPTPRKVALAGPHAPAHVHRPCQILHWRLCPHCACAQEGYADLPAVGPAPRRQVFQDLHLEAALRPSSAVRLSHAVRLLLPHEAQR
ncbi:MAG: hypothetical protein ACRDL7_01305 [Gaiellaceae bacterium]